MLMAGPSGAPIPAGVRYFSLLQNVQNRFGARPTSYSVDSGIFFFLG